MDTCASLAKFTRNLVAGNTANQNRVRDNEPAIRELIFNYTSYSVTQDASSYPVTRLLTQTLSNIVTTNDALAQQLWTDYLSLPEEKLIITRLFASPDTVTVSSAFVFVLNCIHGSASRLGLLVDSSRGPRICLVLLDRIASFFEAEDSSEEGRAFDIGCEIFNLIIEAELIPKLYGKLALEDEPITPHQTTLLKLVDSFLHRSKFTHELSSRRPDQDGSYLLGMLTHEFLALSAYAQTSIRRTLGSPVPHIGTDPDASVSLQELDLLLPKVCEGLVLAVQCLTTIMLRAQETNAFSPSQTHVESAYPSSPNPVMVASATFPGQGFVKSLIEILRLIGTLIPRITYGKVVQAPSTQGREMFQDATPPMASNPRDAKQDPKLVQAAQAFSHIKRDLVRLLGILALDNRAVQDRVRECGGLPVVMNLCVIDDYNPYLREHAIFALRNLLCGNLESQAVVDGIKPVGKWDEDKVFQEIQGQD
ncbi:spinocerebellar ataxia type 10 protein domain-containing protein [Ganoderma leucocontextum]|nr:spinocerebellar ataxia type 10 protein domain-containing protein [Ganoderma leucocontextum]